MLLLPQHSFCLAKRPAKTLDDTSSLIQIHVLDSSHRVTSKCKFLIMTSPTALISPASQGQYTLCISEIRPLRNLPKPTSFYLNLPIQPEVRNANTLHPQTLIQACGPGPISLALALAGCLHSALTSPFGPSRHAMSNKLIYCNLSLVSC